MQIRDQHIILYEYNKISSGTLVPVYVYLFLAPIFMHT